MTACLLIRREGEADVTVSKHVALHRDVVWSDGEEQVTVYRDVVWSDGEQHVTVFRDDV
jgi:hypothetical protein